MDQEQVDSKATKNRHSWTIATVVMLVVSVVIFWAITQMTAAMFDQMGRRVVAAVVLECLAIGVVVMASIQAVRGVVPVRGVFHRQCMVLWLSRPTKIRQLLDERLDKANSLYALSSPTQSAEIPKRRVERLPSPEVAVVQLLDLATTGSRQDVEREGKRGAAHAAASS